MTVEQWAQPISDAARIVRATTPRHSLDLEDLVQIGWEATLRYLSPGSVSRVLVFVAAKSAMLTASAKWLHKAWSRNGSGNRVRGGPAPRLEGYHHWMQVEPTPPMELFIDLRRAFERLRAEERGAWAATRWRGETVADAGTLLGCRPATVIARARIADKRLILAAGGKSAARAGRTPVHSRKRDQFRARYRELRALGVEPAKANRAAHAQHAYATLLRQVSP